MRRHAIALVLAAAASFAQGQQLVRLPAEKDRPPVDVRLIPAPQTGGVGSTATITLSVLSRVNLESSAVTIVVAGPATSPALADGNAWRQTERGKSLLRDAPVRQTSMRNFGALKEGERRELRIDLRFTGAGTGYVAAGVRSPADGTPLLNETMTLYFLVDDNAVHWSTHSILAAREQQLRARLRRRGVREEDIEKQVERLRRSGAKVEKKKTPPAKKQGAITSDPASYNSVTVEGTVLFQDVNGNTHPVTFANVEIWDEEAGADELVDTTTTDAAGQYSTSVDDNDGDGTGRDFYVVALAEGTTVAVDDAANPGTIWSIDSLPAEVDVADDSTLTIDLTATNNQADANNVAFEVYQSVNALSRFLSNLGEPLPAQVIMRYPQPGDGSSHSGGIVSTAGTDNHDWDNLHHEYAHHIQNLYNIENSPGGPHNLGTNLCTLNGKDAGLRLSWGEAWATFFGLQGQRELNMGALNIPNLGDTSYTDTKPVPPDLTYNLEPSSVLFQGESDEVAAQRVLWDLYDPANDDGDTVALTAQDMWDVITADESHTFSEFWRATVLPRAESQRAAFGEILQDHGIGAAPTAPAGGTTYSGGALPNFQWTANLECDTGGNALFSIRAYNNDFTSLAWASPWQAAANITPTNAQRDLMFVGPSGPMRWLVASRDTTAPETGSYYGSSLIINDDFDVPDRGPVDLILTLDVSDSMNSPVPGATIPLTKIQLLRQAAEIFVQTWRLHRVDGDRVGVVYLNSDTSSIPGAPPVLRDLATDADAIINDIRAKNASGCTAIGGALQVSFDSFDAVMNKRVIILFSDGMQSINPFVGEEGMPARLKIMTFPPASSLPLGAFFCSDETANDLGGADVVPDGQFLDDHAIQIHTIGVGVDGADFTSFVQRIADETSALSHFTSAPDEELDIFYTNDLVNSLKTATLEVVKTSAGPLAAGATKSVLVPVNETAISLTVVLSWKATGPATVGLTVMAPGGATIAPTEVRQGPFYRIEKFRLPPKTKAGQTVSGVGNWTVRLNGPTTRDVQYQLSAIVDEPCFHYRFDTPHRTNMAGDRIPLSVALSQSGKPVLQADGIYVEVTRPAENNGNLLAEWLPQMKPRQLEREKFPQTDPAKAEFYAALAAAYENREFVKRARAKTTERVLLFDDGLKEHGDPTAGDGIYSGYLASTQIPGSYALNLNIQASSRCGRVMRTESSATLVQLASADRERSVLTAIPGSRGTYTVVVAPVDRFGNLLGPGNPRSIEILGKGVRPSGELRDRLDGSYEQLIAVDQNENPSITVLVNGEQLATIPLNELVRDFKMRTAK